MTQLGTPEYIVMTALWGWEPQWHRSTGWRDWTTQSGGLSPTQDSGRAKTEAELQYGKVDGESLGVLTGILCNKLYFYGTKCMVVVDHLPLVPMYKYHSKALPVRVAKHKSKLKALDFDVVYEAGITTPSDYGSRHPPNTEQHTAEEREELRVETEEEDAEVVIARIDSMTDVVTMPILVKYTEKEYKRLPRDVQQGKMMESTTKLIGIKECFEELSVNQGIILRGERLLIPTKLRPDVLDVAHEGCPGGDSMPRMDVWWPGLHQEVKKFTRLFWGLKFI